MSSGIMACYYNSRTINSILLPLIKNESIGTTFNISLIMSVSLHETKDIEKVDIGDVPLNQIPSKSQ